MTGITPGSPVVCLVTRGRGASGTPDRLRLLDRLAAAAGAGVNMVQIRERQFDDRALLRFVQEVMAAVQPVGARVILNERTDVALAAGADGVHLKSDGPPAADVRRIVPPGFLIGRSVHSEEEAARIEAAGGCDYLVFGTVFPSSSKPDDHPVGGIDALRRVCAAVTLPVIAIGGVSPARGVAITGAGAAGAAAISLFAEAQDVAGAAAALEDALTLPSPNV